MILVINRFNEKTCRAGSVQLAYFLKSAGNRPGPIWERFRPNRSVLHLYLHETSEIHKRGGNPTKDSGTGRDEIEMELERVGGIMSNKCETMSTQRFCLKWLLCVCIITMMDKHIYC